MSTDPTVTDPTVSGPPDPADRRDPANPPLVWIRLAARAAKLVTALSHPDLAALLAAAPRRPGTSVSAEELREASGLDLKRFAAAVSRGRNAGVFSAPAPGRLALDHDAVDGLVTELVRLTPLGQTVADRPELRRFARYGRIAEIPADPGQQDALLAVVVDLVPVDRELTEAEINDLLLRASDDPATLRRLLVDTGLLSRSPDGSRYRRVAGAGR